MFVNKLKSYSLIFLSITSLVVSACAGGSSHAKTLNLPVVFEATVEFEVDGQPLVLTKQYNCQVTQYSKAGGDKFVEVTQGDSTVSHVLTSGEVVVVALPHACNRGGVTSRDAEGKPTAYHIAKPLPQGFMPAMLIGDKGPVPDKFALYASEHAYNAPASRIKFHKVNLSVAKTTAQPKPDAYSWLFKKGYEGPAYVGWAARKGIKTPGVVALFNKYKPQQEGVTRIDINDPKDLWFQRYYNGIKGEPKTKDTGNREQILPRATLQNVRTYINGRDVRTSHYGGHYIGFTLDEGQSLHDEQQITVRYRPEQHGIMQLYRAPIITTISGRSLPVTHYNINYFFPSGDSFLRDKSIKFSPMIYDARGRELYQTIQLRLDTVKLKDRKLQQYNIPKVK
jgi:hypothetical protein